MGGVFTGEKTTTPYFDMEARAAFGTEGAWYPGATHHANILCALWKRRGKPVGYEVIYFAMYGNTTSDADRVMNLRVHLHHMRANLRKIGVPWKITTIHGQGLMLTTP